MVRWMRSRKSLMLSRLVFKAVGGDGWGITVVRRSSSSSQHQIRIPCSVCPFPFLSCCHRLKISFKVHIPIIGIDIWEHVGFPFSCSTCLLLTLVDNEGFLSPSTLLSIFGHHEHVLTNAYQYKNVKADVRSFLSAVKN